MPGKKVRILDFDGSVTRQKRLLSKYGPEIISLKKIAPRVRFWSGKRDLAVVNSMIQPSEGSITFLGSGDFHHISCLLMSHYQKPISIINFDLHSDWDILSPFLSCGSWVKEALEKANVKKAVLAGVSSDDISSFWLETGDIGSLKGDRVEIYPYSHKPSYLFLRNIPDNISIKKERGLLAQKVYWNELCGRDLFEFFFHIIKRIPTEDVYVSIDKDCLKKESAVTNWEEGRLALDELLIMLKLIKDNRNIIGADITGDYSDVEVKGILKRMISRIDHPGKFAGEELAEDARTRINEDTNLKILELLSS